jgi:purine-binding chemotaxis protein CheW
MQEDAHNRERSAETVVVRAHRLLCALPMANVVETFRPLPVQPVSGLPGFVRGLSVVRGAPLPVVHLGALLGDGAGEPGQRFVTVRGAARLFVLEVREVLGVRSIAEARLVQAPPLLSGVVGNYVERIGTLDEQLLAVLDSSRLLSDELYDLVVAEGWS